MSLSCGQQGVDYFAIISAEIRLFPGLYALTCSLVNPIFPPTA